MADSSMVDVAKAVNMIASGLAVYSEVDTRWIDPLAGTLEVVIQGGRYRLTVEHCEEVINGG